MSGITTTISFKNTNLVSNIVGNPGPAGRDGDGSSLGSLLPYVNAKDVQFAGGAKGDGVTDDTAALQSFVNYCVNNKRAGFIPAGRYKVTRLYAKYDATNNPSGSTTPRNFKIFGEGRLGDLGQISVSSPDRTVIEFTATSGDLFDFSTQGSPWPMRNIEIMDITLIGTTFNSVLNTSGAFKCSFHRIGIKNNSFVGHGWKLNNFDQCNVKDVFIMGPTNSMSSGIAFDFRSESTAIDGSLSVFEKLLVSNFSIAYQFGRDRDTGTDGNFQSYNVFSSIGCLDCDTAMILGDRWHNNTFISPQLRGNKYGIILTGRNNNNTFISGLAQCNSDTEAVTALYIGQGDVGANKDTQSNYFKNFVFQTNRASAPPVIWNTDGDSFLVKDNVLDTCTFESISTQFASTGISFTNAGNAHIPTGSIIQPNFKRVNVEYSYQGMMINIINPKVSRTLYAYTSTTDGTSKILRSFRPSTDKLISIDAHVVAFDTANPTTTNHASYKIHALMYNNNGTATLVGSSVISNIESNPSMNCSVNVFGNEIRIMVTGVTGVNIDWNSVINAIVII